MRILQCNKNIDAVINVADKNIGPACADKEDVIKESKRQCYEKSVQPNYSRKRKPAYLGN